jgi:hypothetical protein
LTWDDGDKKSAIAFLADKNKYRGVLASLEGITGKKAVNSDSMTAKETNRPTIKCLLGRDQRNCRQ